MEGTMIMMGWRTSKEKAAELTHSAAFIILIPKDYKAGRWRTDIPVTPPENGA
jgi:hypothetical protein